MNTEQTTLPAAIFWDFDGVILNSNAIRDSGFEKVLKDYPIHEVEKLLQYHRQNGGLSRYVKFRYFFESIRNEKISEEEIRQWAEQFSVIMKTALTDTSLLINPTLNYIRQYHHVLPMYIVSGSDQTELRFLCQELGIDSYFHRIHGSPRPKKEWVVEILREENLKPNECVLVGDSINDLDAAKAAGMHFQAYNNPDLNSEGNITLVF